MSSAELASQSKRACIIAAAGCGKTHLIAEAVAKHSARRELILTHTNAGVDVLRRRLRSMKAPATSYDIETLAGWALRYTLAFPVSSGQSVQQPKSEEEWNHTYDSCTRLIGTRPVREIVEASYSGVYVDEYQDCSVDQHKMVCARAAVLPCRILGDPLQGIFGFKKTELVDWDRDIQPHFEMLPELNVPWRWQSASPVLGKWLSEVRIDLIQNRPVDLKKAPTQYVQWIQLPTNQSQHHMARLTALRNAAKKTGTVVAIMRWEAECNKFVNALAPIYHNIETVACDALMQASEHIESNTGIARMDAVVSFACECLTGIKAELQTVITAIKRGSTARKKPYTRQVEMNLLLNIVTSPSLDAVLPALDGLRKIPGTKLWRRELFLEMRRALREYATGQHPDLKTAAWSIRNKTRHAERTLGTRVVSRTLLVKGLEFDHCVILDPDFLSAKELYVALTRGSTSLTILSRNSVLQPKS